MPLFGISRAGLIAMTAAVIALWTCIAMEAVTRRHAEVDARAVSRQLWKLRRASQPVAAPARAARATRPLAS